MPPLLGRLVAVFESTLSLQGNVSTVVLLQHKALLCPLDLQHLSELTLGSFLEVFSQKSILGLIK